MNTEYQADVVIDQATGAKNWVVWIGDDVAANFNSRAALGHFIAGCSAAKLSVYVVAEEQFVCGTVAQLCQ